MNLVLIPPLAVPLVLCHSRALSDASFNSYTLIQDHSTPLFLTLLFDATPGQLMLTSKQEVEWWGIVDWGGTTWPLGYASVSFT